MDRRLPIMKFVTDIKKEKYEQFVLNHKKSHFLQSYTWGEFEQSTTNRIPHYVGLEDSKHTLVAATLLLEKKLPLGLKYFYAPRGYVIDFDNKKLLETFTKELKNYAKKQRSIFIKIDPDVKLQDLDIEGNVITDHKNNFKLVEELKKLGYKHMGFNKNFESNQPRYTFRLDLTPDLEIINQNFHPTTKNILRRGNPYQLELTKNNDANIEDFYLTMMETAKRNDVLYHDIAYYKNFYEILHKEKMSDLYVVTADINKIKNIYQVKINDLEQKSNLKSGAKKQEVLNQLQKAKKEYEEINKIKEDKLVLSSMITAKYGNKVWTIHGGNHCLLRELNANYFIYYEIIKDAKNEGYETIDFFGTTGNPTKDNAVYGIHLFKKRLGGEYTEFMGEFDLVVNPFLYTIFIKLIPCYRSLKRKILKNKK